MSLKTWIRTALGTPVEIVASHPLESKDLLGCNLLIGGVHGDEPLGVELAQQTVNWIQNSPTQKPWVVIPCLNIDGFNNHQRTNGRGVDLNRNYPASNWSRAHKDARYYPGPQPASEPETQGVVSLIQALLPRLIIHCHSWQPCIVCTGERGRSSAELLAQASGYKIVDSIGYETPGSLSQFGWHDHSIPVICIEESDDAAPGTPWPRFGPALQKILGG